MAGAGKTKTKASIDKCGECKSLRETISHALQSAEKRLEDANISGAIQNIEQAREMALLFLTEDHGPDCGFSSLKDPDTQ